MFFACVFPVVLGPFVEDFPASTDDLCCVVRQESTVFMWVCFWAVCSVLLTCFSV